MVKDYAWDSRILPTAEEASVALRNEARVVRYGAGYAIHLSHAAEWYCNRTLGRLCWRVAPGFLCKGNGATDTFRSVADALRSVQHWEVAPSVRVVGC